MAVRLAATLMVMALVSQACNKGGNVDETPSPESGPSANAPSDTAAQPDTMQAGRGQPGQMGQPDTTNQAGQPGQYGQPPAGPDTSAQAGQMGQPGQYGQPDTTNQGGQPGQYGQPPAGPDTSAQAGQMGQPGQYGQPDTTNQAGQPGQMGQPGQYGQPDTNQAGLPGQQPEQNQPGVSGGEQMGQGPSAQPDPETIAMGEKIFHGRTANGSCYACHGSKGKGSATAPALDDDEWLNTDGTMQGITQVIREGVPTPKKFASAMPPMGGTRLNDEQLNAVAAYVYSLSHEENKDK